VIAAGHTAIVDAVFARPEERSQIAAAARASRVPLHGGFLAADLDVRVARVSARARDASHSGAPVARARAGHGPGPRRGGRVGASGDIESTVAAARRAVKA